MKSFKKTIFMPAFQGIDNISGNLLPGHNQRPLQNARWAFLRNNSTLISRLHRIKETLLRWLHLYSFNATFYIEIPKVPGQEHAPAKPLYFLEKNKSSHTKTSNRPDSEWVPLVEADKHAKQQFNPLTLTQQLDANHLNLGGQAVLCVGGRAALYPDYLRLVEAAGGCFMAYRRSPENNRDHLRILLERVNMVICPVDCVSHDDYFVVKQHCKLAGKSCVFLARSSLPTFNQGLKMLIDQFQENDLLDQRSGE